MAKNLLLELRDRGQSVWLDFLSRDFLRAGGLDKLIAEDGLGGVTSNPSIFQKAIGHGDAYDALPWLVYDRRNVKLLLVGGHYTVEPESITG